MLSRSTDKASLFGKVGDVISFSAGKPMPAGAQAVQMKPHREPIKVPDQTALREAGHW